MSEGKLLRFTPVELVSIRVVHTHLREICENSDDRAGSDYHGTWIDAIDRERAVPAEPPCVPVAKCPCCDGWGTRAVCPLPGVSQPTEQRPCLACKGTGLVPKRGTPERLAAIEKLAGSAPESASIGTCPCCGGRTYGEAEVPSDRDCRLRRYTGQGLPVCLWTGCSCTGNYPCTIHDMRAQLARDLAPYARKQEDLDAEEES